HVSCRRMFIEVRVLIVCSNYELQSVGRSAGTPQSECCASGRRANMDVIPVTVSMATQLRFHLMKWLHRVHINERGKGLVQRFLANRPAQEQRTARGRSHAHPLDHSLDGRRNRKLSFKVLKVVALDEILLGKCYN